jgi:hypothetical protein
MLRKFRFWCGLLILLAVAVTMVHRLRAFTLWGQLETFQTAALSYGTRYWYSFVSLSNAPVLHPGNGTYTEQGGPKNFGEGARLNVPTITYAYDASFLSYFGTDGVKAVDAAFAIMNRLPRVSSASPNLTEFIQQGNQQINYTARALNMMDMKSAMLQLLVEHAGLLGETHVFDLLSQQVVITPCFSDYFVGIRNFDPITYDPSTYVNGTLYDFQIKDACPVGTAIADAVEEAHGQPGQWLSIETSAVATAESLQLGGYYLNLTRDDFGGLRYLYRQNNYVYEPMPDTHTWVASTIVSGFSPVGTTNLTDDAWIGTVGGIEKVTYVKVAFDSGVGGTYPTNSAVIQYNLNILTNFQHAQVTVYRSNTEPDIIITAANLLATPGAGQDQPFTRSNILVAPPASLNTAETLPYVINPTNLITFNNVGAIGLFENPTSLVGSAAFANPYFQFGSFDGSTNPPIAFPTGRSLLGLITLELTAPPSQFVISSFAPVLATNTTAGGGTGGGAAGGGGGGAGAGAASVRRYGASPQ